ncbi:RING finger protein 141 [Frankliniella fusca]|uniref:RING finger protein 141 n=1 Tax=Frankliniella fusca TaxID=407009 RepID=A0AAE1HK58_9NEOP|nr:RING finger protein 141 [Frankliniella fusca]
MSLNGDDAMVNHDEAQQAPAPPPPPQVVKRYTININLVGHSVNDSSLVAAQILRDLPGAAALGGNLAAVAALAPGQGPAPGPSTSAGPPKCKICFEPRSNRMLPCGHFGCEGCLQEWMRVNPRCPDPLCRSSPVQEYQAKIWRMMAQGKTKKAAITCLTD